MANFFINRPVFAWVIAIILMMAGAIAIPNMPVAQYPSIAPPAVSITVKMRIWPDPAKLDHYSLTPEDVSRAIEAQNVQISSGELGGLPSISKQQLNATVIGPSRMQTPEEFSKILLKVNPDSSQVRLRDVATVDLGPENYSITGKYNGKPAAAIGLKLATGANALKTAEAVKATIEKLKSIFPHGLEVEYPYDTTPFVKESIKEVVKTLFEAIGLVFLVMYLFLQNIRATLIPTLVAPVVLLGTFAVLSLAGFGINILTMLAMVLAIGLLVDDAIVEETPKNSKRSHGATRHCRNRARALGRSLPPSRNSWRCRSYRGSILRSTTGRKSSPCRRHRISRSTTPTGRRATASRARWWCKVR
jgi:multidrug efflux pump subunit AcrB